MRRFFISLLWLAALALPALAADKAGPKKLEADVPEVFTRSWTGVYVGGTVGYGVLTEGGISGLSQQDWLFGVNVGGDVQLSRYWVAGIFGDYEFPKTGSFDQGWWTLGGRAGYLMTPDTLVYGLGGYSQTYKDVAIIGSKPTGMVAGGGIEYRLGAGWATKLEYRHTFVDISGLPISVDGNEVRLGISYKFGAN